VNENFSTFLTTVFEYGPRILGALTAGLVIGIEGEISKRAAGLRTLTLILLSTTLFAILSISVSQRFGGDPARIAAQIITGIGFLGAGVIMHSEKHIHGITTAATIFVAAAIGVTIGFGYIYSGVALAFLVAAILLGLRPVARAVQNNSWVTRYRERQQNREQP